MKRNVSPLFALAIFATAGYNAHAALVADFVSATTPGYTDGDTRVVGWSFTTKSTPVYLVSLAFYDDNKDGLQTVHSVGLYKTSTQNLVATTDVPAGTTAFLDGFFRRVEIPAVLLDTNTSYTLAAGVPANSDRWVWEDSVVGVSVSGLTIDPLVDAGTLNGRYILGSSALAFPVTEWTGDSRNFFFGPNVGLSTVPEPGICSLFLLGALGTTIRRRCIR